MVSVKVTMPSGMDGFGTELGRSMDKAMDKLSDDIVTRVRAEVRKSPPTHGRNRAGKPHSSREQAAKGVTAKVTTDSSGTTVAVRSDGSKMAHGREAFPAAYGMARWSHPVFGNRKAQVTQRGAGDWFADTIKTFKDRVERELTDAANEAAKTIK